MNYVTMDYKFLNKVIDQLAYETEIDHDNGSIYFPFILDIVRFASSGTSSGTIYVKLMIFFTMGKFISSFINHCRDIYGLNGEEILYVSGKYKDILKDKIKNNEL